MVYNWHINSMKKRSIILTLLAIVATFGLITSCSKAEKKILGSWECTSAELINPAEGEDIEMAGTVFVFKEDNTVTITSEDETQSGTYTITDDKLNVTIEMTEERMTMALNLDMDIQELSNSKLDVEGTMTYVYQGMTLDTSKFKASFKKQ